MHTRDPLQQSHINQRALTIQLDKRPNQYSGECYAYIASGDAHTPQLAILSHCTQCFSYTASGDAKPQQAVLLMHRKG